MKLLALLFESVAADTAHKLGLVYKGHGYWADRRGNTVAHTVDDTLVRINNTRDEPTDISTQYNPNKQKLKRPPYPLRFGTPMKSAEFLDQAPLHPQEEVYGLTEDNWIDYIAGKDVPMEVRTFVRNEAVEDGTRQNKQFRKRLSPRLQAKLLITQCKWQDSSQYYQHPEDREQMRTAFQSICGRFNPTINSTGPISRGMRMDNKTAEEYLKNFAIGEDIDIPPSGFSSHPTLCRSFAEPVVEENQNVGVIIRIHPNDRKLYGLRLHNLDLPINSDVLHGPGLDIATTIQTYNVELEVVRYSGPKAKCVSIKRMIKKGTDQSVYIIDLEEQEIKQPTVDENINAPSNVKHIFDMLMGTSVGYWNPNINRN